MKGIKEYIPKEFYYEFGVLNIEGTSGGNSYLNITGRIEIKHTNAPVEALYELQKQLSEIFHQAIKKELEAQSEFQ